MDHLICFHWLVCICFFFFIFISSLHIKHSSTILIYLLEYYNIFSGEKVDIHIIREPGNGEWTHLTTEDSDKNGRVTYTIPENKSLGFGIYPVKMVVR